MIFSFVISSGTLSVIGIVHKGVSCSECNASDIAGLRWSCVNCENVDLCSKCYHDSQHNIDHFFVVMSSPESGR